MVSCLSLLSSIHALLTDSAAPFMQILMGGDLSLLPVYYGASVKSALIAGHVIVAGSSQEDIAGVAVWYPPGQESFGTYVAYSV